MINRLNMRLFDSVMNGRVSVPVSEVHERIKNAGYKLVDPELEQGQMESRFGKLTMITSLFLTVMTAGIVIVMGYHLSLLGLSCGPEGGVFALGIALHAIGTARSKRCLKQELDSEEISHLLVSSGVEPEDCRAETERERQNRQILEKLNEREALEASYEYQTVDDSLKEVNALKALDAESEAAVEDEGDLREAIQAFDALVDSGAGISTKNEKMTFFEGVGDLFPGSGVKLEKCRTESEWDQQNREILEALEELEALDGLQVLDERDELGALKALDELAELAELYEVGARIALDELAELKARDGLIVLDELGELKALDALGVPKPDLLDVGAENEASEDSVAGDGPPAGSEKGNLTFEDMNQVQRHMFNRERMERLMKQCGDQRFFFRRTIVV